MTVGRYPQKLGRRGDQIILGDTEHDLTTPGNAIHLEDGQYKEVNTNEMYDHYDADHKCDNIESIIETEFDPVSGKLMALVLWDDGQLSQVDAEMIRVDDPMRLAKHIIDSPAEKLRSRFWNKWANETMNSISISIR
jgi:hypothetical protein